jgi:hypothetical protein
VTWPTQDGCDAFYGNPRGRNGQPSAKWESANLVRLTPPWQMYYDKKPIKSMRIHKLVCASALRAMEQIWIAYGKNQKTMDDLGLSIFGGSYNFRLMRGGSRLSMHSWGIAIDFDPARNQLHWPQAKARLGRSDCTPFWEAWEKEGWVSLGRKKNYDWMHIQAARL